MPVLTVSHLCCLANRHTVNFNKDLYMYGHTGDFKISTCVHVIIDHDYFELAWLAVQTDSLVPRLTRGRGNIYIYIYIYGGRERL